METGETYAYYYKLLLYYKNTIIKYYPQIQ